MGTRVLIMQLESAITRKSPVEIVSVLLIDDISRAQKSLDDFVAETPRTNAMQCNFRVRVLSAKHPRRPRQLRSEGVCVCERERA